jgi:tetratricopeptide (TPR) repeat protein
MDERIAELAAIALYRAGRPADALAELAALRQDLSEQLGMSPGPAITELERRIVATDASLEAPTQAEATRETRKTVTVTALRLPPGDPEEVRAATAAVADLFEGIVANLGGWAPPGGSGRLLGVFGLPSVHEDDAERAVMTADAMNRTAVAMGLEPRIGIATGEVLAELTGDEVRLLTHDPVEVADQLARKARGGEVLLGVATHRLARTVAEVDPEPLLVLDAESPIVAHRLINVAERRASPRLSAPLVGRSNELLRLRDGAMRALEERRPTLLTMLGPAGVGKSRLLAGFAAGLGDRVEVAVGRCLPYGRDTGMWPVAQIVRAIAGIPAEGGAAAARRKLASSLAGEQDGDVLSEQLGALVGLSDRSPAPDEMSWAIRRFLEIAARRQPLVVGIEDLQWADDSLLDLVAYVASSTSNAPIAFVITARPELVERRPLGGGGADAETIRLEALDADTMDELLVQLLGTSELEPSARSRITEIAEGNPLFLEEIVSILIDDGLLHERERRWVPVGDLASVPLPPSVRALLEARVDRLPIAEREVLEAAAIAGREFGDEDLEDLRPDGDAAELSAALDALCRRDFLRLQRYSRPGSRSYEFRHILLRDVVYRDVPREVRARDHEALGRGLIERAGERLGEVQDIVGFHLETAYHLRRGLATDAAELRVVGRDAAAHLGAAGRRAFGRDDLAGAASLLTRALACADRDDPQRGELARLRGGALFDLGRFDEAEAALQEALDAAGRGGDDALRWRVLLERTHVGAYLRPDGQTGASARAFAEEALHALTLIGDVAGQARAHRLLGEALLLQGQEEEATEAFLEGWRLAQQAGDERELSIRPPLTGLHGPMPLPAFIRQCERVLADSPRPRPETLLRLAFAEALVGRDEEARAHITEGLTAVRDIGGAFRIADAELHAGAADLYMGDHERAARSLERSVEGLEEIGEQSVRATAVSLLGEAYLRLGRIDDADVAAEHGRGIAAEDDQAAQISWRQVRAKVLAARGSIDEARALIDAALRVAEATDFLTMTAFAHLDASQIAAAAGDDEGARRERALAQELLAGKGVSERVVERIARQPVGP